MMRLAESKKHWLSTKYRHCLNHQQLIGFTYWVWHCFVSNIHWLSSFIKKYHNDSNLDTNNWSVNCHFSCNWQKSFSAQRSPFSLAALRVMWWFSVDRRWQPYLQGVIGSLTSCCLGSSSRGLCIYLYKLDYFLKTPNTNSQFRCLTMSMSLNMWRYLCGLCMKR